jgi:hypothetical protein
MLRAAVVMDIEQLDKDILSALPSDPLASELLANTPDPRWTVDAEGFLRRDNRIYVQISTISAFASFAIIMTTHSPVTLVKIGRSNSFAASILGLPFAPSLKIT